MVKKMVAEGRVVLRDKAFFYEFWSNNLDVTIRIYHQGKKANTQNLCDSTPIT